MNVRDVQDLYEYSYWANRKLFEVVNQLTPDQFTQNVGGGFGSVRNTLVHMLSAEAGWLERCGGAKRGPRLVPEDYPTTESVVDAWTKVEGHVREFLATLSDGDVIRDIEYANPAGEMRRMPIGEMLQHAVNHGVHHRGQVALLIRMMGVAPGIFDLLIYYGEKRGVPVW